MRKNQMRQIKGQKKSLKVTTTKRLFLSENHISNQGVRVVDFDL